MSKKDYSLALKFTAKTSEVARKVRGLGRQIDMNMSTSSSRATRGIGKIVNGFSIVSSAVMRVGGVIGGVFAGGLRMALGLVGRIAGALRALPMAGLKLLAIGGAAVFATHKALGPAGEMERYRTQLDVMKKSRLYNFLTNASAGKPFQMGESVRAGVLMEAFKISSKKYLSTVMDAASAFKKPLEEIVRMLGYARSGRAGEAIESAGNIGITRGDLKKFGIKFEKSGAVTTDTVGKLLQAMTGLMKSRFGGMATRIGTGTYEGAVSDMKDSFFRAVAKAGEKFLPYATSIVRRISMSATTIGDKLASLPWDRWGQKLASGVNAAGNIIDNLLDPKRRADIASSLAAGWKNIQGEIPKLGRALVVDSVALWAVTIKPKMIDIVGKAFTASKGLLTNPLVSALTNLWNYIWKGLTTVTMGFLAIQNLMIPSFMRVSAKTISNFGKKMDSAGIIADPDETARLKWEKQRSDAEDAARKHDYFSETRKIAKTMYQKSGIEKTLKQATAPQDVEKIKPILLSLLRPGRDSGYLNGRPVPLSSENIQSNEAVRTLARILPDMFSVKKETDVFGREIKQFSLNMKTDNQENLNYQKRILLELEKLNSLLGGN